jgi:anti-sigma regulatory factor (Ser/Thr protein kinase)
MEPLTIPGALPALEPVGKYVMDAAAEAGLEKSAAYKLRLAVDEIVTNIIVHGYGESGTEGEVRIETHIDDEKLELLVEDTATPFDPRSIAPPPDLNKPLEERQIGGLGIFLVYESVDEFRYEHDGQHNRNVFVVKRDSSSKSAAEKVTSRG